MKQHLVTRYLTNRNNLLLLIILGIGALLLFYKLNSLMLFISDQGWFYVSARDMLLTHHIPLVGIASSHPWIHQGALWTYILGVILFIFNFNPVFGAYFTAILGFLTIILVYRLSRELFSGQIALIASFIYATSPIVIHDSRMAYHTGLIPILTTLLMYFVFKWVKGNINFFPLIILTLALLYNSEIATFSLFACVFLILAYGFASKKDWAKKLFNKKTILLSVLVFLITMMPMLLYDLHHGFPQTLKFIVWLFYRIAVFLGYPQIHPDSPGETWATFFPYLTRSIQNFVFLKSALISALVLVSSSLFVFQDVMFAFKNKKVDVSKLIIFIFFFVPALSYITAKTNSSAYFLMMYPQVAILIALFFGYLLNKKYLFFPALLTLLLIGLSNSYLLLKNNYFTPVTYSNQLEASKLILKKSNNRAYNIVGKGKASIYESFTTPYTYLTWYLGHGPSKKNEKLKFYVSEYPDKIVIEEHK